MTEVLLAPPKPDLDTRAVQDEVANGPLAYTGDLGVHPTGVNKEEVSVMARSARRDAKLMVQNVFPAILDARARRAAIARGRLQ